MYIDVIESPLSLRCSPHIGDSKPLHAASTGKTLMTTLTYQALLYSLPRLLMSPITAHTIISRKALLEDLNRGHLLGWHEVQGENVLDLLAVSCAVHLQGETLAI